MQQRRLRLGDILDDYCPRERRITNHAVVAMIEDQVKQTRCTTCDADHEYKQARVPLRRKKDAAALAGEIVSGGARPRAASQVASDDDGVTDDLLPDEDDGDAPSVTAELESEDGEMTASGDDRSEDAEPDEERDDIREPEDGPVHRRLIRATLPRPEGQAPEWKPPDFTIRQPGGRGREFDGNRDGNSPGQRSGGRGRRPVRAQGGPPGQPSRAGGPRDGNQRQGPPNGQNGNRPNGSRPPGRGPGRGPRPPGGQGRRRGR